MAVSSMTGFARAAGSSGPWRWAFELKTVNAKGLDIRLRMPAPFDRVETEARARLAKALARAKIEGQHRYLLRGSRGDEQARDEMLPDLVPLRAALAAIDGAADRDSLRGVEGSAAVAYFRGLARRIHAAVESAAELKNQVIRVNRTAP